MKSVSHSPSIFSVFLCYAALLQVVVASSWVRYNVKPSESVGRRYTDALQGQDDTFDSLIALVGASATVNQKASSSDFETLFLNKNGVTAVASSSSSKRKGGKNSSRASAPPITGLSDTIPNSESVAARLSELYEDFTARHFIVHLPVFIEKFVKTIYGVHVESAVEGRSHLFDQIKAFKIVYVNGQFSVYIYLDVTWRFEPNISELLPFNDEVSAFFVSANSALFLESRKGFRIIAQSLDSSFKATVSPSTAATAVIVTESTPTRAAAIPSDENRKLTVEEADEEVAQREREDLIAREEAEKAKRNRKAQTKKAKEEKNKMEQLERQHRINQEKAEREEKAKIADEARKEAQRIRALEENEIKKEADRVKAELRKRQEEEAELKRKQEQEQEAERKRQKAERKNQQAELKRQEVERKRKEAELKRQEEEEAELQRQQAELKKQEIERKRQEEEEAELQRQQAEHVRKEAELKMQKESRRAEFNRQQAIIKAKEAEIRSLKKAQRQAEESLKAARQAKLQAQADRQREGAEIKKMSAEDSHSSMIRSVTQAEEKVRKLQEEAEQMNRELIAARAFILEQQRAQAQAASQQVAQAVSQQNVISSPDRFYQIHALNFPTLMTDNISSFGAPGSAKSTSSMSPGVIGDSNGSNGSNGGAKISGDINSRPSLVTDFFDQQLDSSSLNTPVDDFFGFQEHHQFPSSAFNSPEYGVLSALRSGGSETKSKSQQLEQEQKKSEISFIDSILSGFENNLNLTEEDPHSDFETLSPHLNTQAEAFIPGSNWSPTSAKNGFEQPANTMFGNVDSYPAPLMVHDQYMMQQTPQFFGQQGTFNPQPAAIRQPVYDHYGALQQTLPTRGYNHYSPQSHFQQQHQQQMQHSYEFYQQQQQQQSLTPPGFSPQRQQQQQRNNPYIHSQQQQHQYKNQPGRGFGF